MINYLGYPILACCDDWIIVDDCKYNYYLFNVSQEENIRRYMHGWMPVNNVGYYGNSNKYTEFYTDFDIAVKNMCRCKANDGFINKIKVLK